MTIVSTFEFACLQTRPMPDFEAAIGEAMPLAESAVRGGAQFVFLPEYCGGLRTDGGSIDPPSAPEASHPVLAAFRTFAREQGIWTMLGSIAIHGPDGKIFNRGYVLDDSGAVRSRYDKIHLFDVDLSPTEKYRESEFVVPGAQSSVCDTPFGRIGHTICYDLRFPHLYRTLAQEGAEILCIPAAFTKYTGEAHWHVLNRARAIENGAFVIAPCATGAVPGGGESYGHSLIIGPWGEVLADGGASPGVVLATIDLARVATARERIPSLRHDRRFSLPGTGTRSVA